MTQKIHYSVLTATSRFGFSISHIYTLFGSFTDTMYHNALGWSALVTKVVNR